MDRAKFDMTKVISPALWAGNVIPGVKGGVYSGAPMQQQLSILKKVSQGEVNL